MCKRFTISILWLITFQEDVGSYVFTASTEGVEDSTPKTLETELIFIILRGRQLLLDDMLIEHSHFFHFSKGGNIDYYVQLIHFVVCVGARGITLLYLIG